ncbi:hypothetical protein AAL_01571 [Moelleriella libera RCEF 2490]|uniref:Zinc knuckle CX2CX3GHX4C domain-containing protein n=1 Tax=Moelleriella libera RCEF 2490 TaxID=1081109 RepID=A0A166U9P2_9HYPO|nr:hypothetical protein AAL_01571 [Moelleriella libera RCEF 2490]
MSIYIVWLMARSFWGDLPDQMLEEWCLELKKHGLPAEIATTLQKAPLKSWRSREPPARFPDLRGTLNRLVQRVEKCYGLSQHEQLPAGTQNPEESQANPSAQKTGAVAVTEPVPRVLEVPSSMCLGSEQEPNNSTNTIEGDPRLATITDEPLGKLATPTDGVSLDSLNAHLQPQDVYICGRCRVSGRPIADAPVGDDSSLDPPPPSRYICNICGEFGHHWVWNCPHRIIQATRHSEDVSAPKTNSSAAYENQESNDGKKPLPAEASRGCSTSPIQQGLSSPPTQTGSLQALSAEILPDYTPTLHREVCCSPSMEGSRELPQVAETSPEVTTSRVFPSFTDLFDVVTHRQWIMDKHRIVGITAHAWIIMVTRDKYQMMRAGRGPRRVVLKACPSVRICFKTGASLLQSPIMSD